MRIYGTIGHEMMRSTNDVGAKGSAHAVDAGVALRRSDAQTEATAVSSLIQRASVVHWRKTYTES